MSFYLYLLAGLGAGLLGGMGMGGGTLLIPVLTIFLGVEQHIAQAANLVAFLPMAAFSLNAHKKSGLLRTDGVLSVVIPAAVISIAGGLIASLLPAMILRRFFGLFLLFLAFRGAAKLKLTP